MTDTWHGRTAPAPQGWPAPTPAPVEPYGEPQGVPVTICTAGGVRTRYRRLPQLLEAGVLPVDTLLPDRSQTVLFLPPGHLRLSFASQYWVTRVARATLDIDTTQGPQTVHYAAPYTIWSAGTAGFGPRAPRRPGGTFVVWLVVGIIGVVILVNIWLFVLSQS